MHRRTLLAGAVSLAGTALAGCGGETDHLATFRKNLEERGLELNGVERVDDEVVLAEFETNEVNDDIASVGLAFVDRIDAGWDVNRLDGLARGDADLGWHAETEWAEQYLAGEMSPEEYGALLSDTTERVVVIDGEDDEATVNDTAR